MGVLRAWIAVISTFWILFKLPLAQAETSEYQIKAAMLYNFALFVEWPAQAFSSDLSPFAVCVLGKDPFGPWLKHELGEAKVGTHPVEIRILEKADDARNCHLLFISRSEESHLQSLLGQLQNAAVLIISDVTDITDFCRKGGMIGLLMKGNRVRFELNANAAAKAGLKISSKLERVARSAKCGEAE